MIQQNKLISNYLFPLAILLVLIIVFLLSLIPVQSDDLFIYLALGRIFFKAGHFPVSDPFLFSITQNLWNILPEWGSYLLFYIVYLLGNFSGLVIFKTVIILATASLPIILMKSLKYKSISPLILILIAAYSSSPRFIERSDLFSTFFTASVLLILIVRATRGSPLLLLPVIFFLWVNIHPGFAVGLILCLIYLSKKTFWPIAFSFIASLINPRFLNGLILPFQAAVSAQTSGAAVKNYYEFMPAYHPLYIHTPEVIIFFLLIFFGAVLIYLNKNKKPIREILVYLFFSLLGISAIRFVPVAAFSLAVLETYIASQINLLPYSKSIKSPLSFIPYLFPLAGIFIIIYLIFNGYDSFNGKRKLGLGIARMVYPFEAARFIDKHHLATPIFNQHDFGSFLAWYWDGNRKIFYHGFVDNNHLDFYQSDYLGVTKSRTEFDRIVKKYAIGAFLLANYGFDPKNPPLIYRILSADPGWKMVFYDRVSVLFVKDIPENRAFLISAGIY